MAILFTQTVGLKTVANVASVDPVEKQVQPLLV